MGKILPLIALLLLFGAGYAFSQVSDITGTVTSAENGQPLSFVTIVVKGTTKFTPAELKELTEHLSCTESELPDYGYYPSGKKGEYLQYETESDLRDTENVPLKENIYSYFLQEVKPHVAEAWVNLDATQIGYEISFNKYFYRPKPLRSVEEISEEILALEGEGLIREILNLV